MSKPQPIWILRDYERCSGCRLCEIACSLRHEGRVWPEASRIKIFEIVPSITVPILCVQCPDYPCIKACPVNALKADEITGAVIVDEGKCILCRQCIDVCPGKIPRIVSGKDSVIICDLCKGDPECVKACEQAGYHALKLVTRPTTSTIKLYARMPEEITRSLVLKILKLKPEEVM